jgi:hypothetical protein
MKIKSIISSKKIREIEIIESIKQKSTNKTIEIYSAINRVFASRLKLKITKQKSSKIFTSIKSSFVSLKIDEMSRITSQNQFSVIIFQTLQVFLIESILLIKSKKEIIKRRNMKKEFNIKSF